MLKFRPEIQKVVCVFDIEVGGTPTALDFFNGKLVAAYDFKLHLFTWEGAALVEDVITYTTGLTTVSLFALNSKDILVADYMEPLELVSLSHGSLVQRCRDIFHSSFTAVIPITETIYLATDCFYNVFCVEKRVPKKVKKGGSNGSGDSSNNNNDEDDDDDEEDEDENAKKEKYMTNVAEFHVGEYVTCLKKMSISGRHSNSNAVTYTTTNGSVGEVWMLSRDDFMFWATVEGAIANLSISQIGGLTHAEWRAYSTERRVTPVARFVDFDTIRLFKDLDREDACAVCRALRSFGTVSVEELSRRIDGVLGK